VLGVVTELLGRMFLFIFEQVRQERQGAPASRKRI
jgi:hypothetical protein